MVPRFITKSIHAYLDYPVALGLMAMPFLFGLGESNTLAFWLSVTTGLAALLLTVLTVIAVVGLHQPENNAVLAR